MYSVCCDITIAKKPLQRSDLCIKAAPISLSPNFGGVRFFGEIQLFDDKRNALEGNHIDHMVTAGSFQIVISILPMIEVSPGGGRSVGSVRTTV